MPAPMSAPCTRRAWPASAAYFFAVSRARPSDDGLFNGVVAIAALPSYFEEFLRAHGPRQRRQLFRTGARGRRFLARFPVPKDRQLKLDDHSQFRAGVMSGLDRYIYSVDFADRPYRPPHRLSQALWLSALRARRRGEIGDHERLARLYEQPSDFRPAGDRVPLCRAGARLAPHQTPLRRSRPARGRGRRAAPGAAAGSDRQTDRRRRARFQQSADDHQRQRAAPARRADRQEAYALARHDRDRDAARRNPDPPALDLFAPADAEPAGDRSHAAVAADPRTAAALLEHQYRHQGRRA